MASPEQFVASRRASWARFEALLAQARSRRLSSMSAEQIEELGRLYRHVTSDLAVAQRDFPRDRIALYLNQLLARAHPHVYRGSAAAWRDLRDFWLVGYPRLFRAHAAYIIAAAAFFLGSALLSYLAVLLAPEQVGPRLLPPHLVALVRDGRMWTEIPESARPFASSFIMTNNIQVSFLAYAGGVLAGVLTTYVLVTNGVLLGAIGAYCQVHGLALPLWSFVSPHGYIELSVIMIAGGAGLRMGWAVLRPGLRTRRAALVEAGGQAARLVIGCVPLLVVAGVVEGFLSPSGLPPAFKLAFGPLTGLGLYTCLLVGGRPPRARWGGIGPPAARVS